MQRRSAPAALRSLACLACLVLLHACAADHPVWQGFEGTPARGLGAYTAHVRMRDLRDGAELGAGLLCVSQGALRYEMHDPGPFGGMILLARLDSGQAWLVNPAGKACLEGAFAPRRWMEIGYLLEAFPKIARPRILASNEEVLGSERIFDYKTVQIRLTGRAVLFGEERDFTELFWLAEEFCIPLRHERDMVRTELTRISKDAPEDSFFTLPADCRKASSLVELLK